MAAGSVLVAATFSNPERRRGTSAIDLRGGTTARRKLMNSFRQTSETKGGRSVRGNQKRSKMAAANVPVDGDGGEREAAGVHGQVDEEVNDFAHEGAEDPALQRVDGGLERDAEDDEEEVGHAEVEDEEVGGVVAHLAAPQQHGQHQAVPHRPQEEDERENHRHDDAGQVELVAVGRLALIPRFGEVLKVRHVGNLNLQERKQSLFIFNPEEEKSVYDELLNCDAVKKSPLRTLMRFCL